MTPKRVLITMEGGVIQAIQADPGVVVKVILPDAEDFEPQESVYESDEGNVVQCTPQWIEPLGDDADWFDHEHLDFSLIADTATEYLADPDRYRERRDA